jgi:hypothetical protein
VAASKQAARATTFAEPYIPSSNLSSLPFNSLENCDAGYSPTRWQTSLFPALYQAKIRTIFDGVVTTLWYPMSGVPRRVAGRDIPDDTRIVTYVSRGMESMRGFDIFMRAAKILCGGSL